MTTVHANTPPVKGGKTAEARQVHLVLKGKDGKLQELEASLPEVLKAVRDSGGVGVFDLQIDGDAEQPVIVLKVEKENQTITGLTLRHVTPNDFIRVDVELAAKNLPDLVLQHKAEAVRLQKRVKVRARVKDLPKRIVVDLSELAPAGTFMAGDLSLPTGVELLTPKDAELFTVRASARAS